jgi:hypothetical protein
MKCSRCGCPVVHLDERDKMECAGLPVEYRNLLYRLDEQIEEANKVIENLVTDMSETIPIMRHETIGGAKLYLEKYKDKWK